MDADVENSTISGKAQNYFTHIQPNGLTSAVFFDLNALCNNQRRFYLSIYCDLNNWRQEFWAIIPEESNTTLITQYS